MINPIEWTGFGLRVLDQVMLPAQESFIEVNTLEATIKVIADMHVRGAPCIGFVGLYGSAFIVRDFEVEKWEDKAKELVNSRPTAVNLSYEVNRSIDFARELVQGLDRHSVFEKIIEFCQQTISEAEQKHIAMAHWGEVALKKYVSKSSFKLQTHCNTGTLACGTLGTALGIIEKLAEKALIEKVWVDETRPYLQGSRLTAFELGKKNIPYEIVVEGAASFLMSRGYVDAIFVGADRIAANGDTANKIGTANLAIIARRYNIPFFVAAPLSSFDFSTETGRDIEIETRSQIEILQIKNERTSPFDASAYNPSFDITPCELITAIISEKGIVDAPNSAKMKLLVGDRYE